jgi:hypothetical protein
MIPPGGRVVFNSRGEGLNRQHHNEQPMTGNEPRAVEILLVEDSPSDTELTLAALEEAKLRNHVSTVEDGVQAIQQFIAPEVFLNASLRAVKTPRPRDRSTTGSRLRSSWRKCFREARIAPGSN